MQHEVMVTSGANQAFTNLVLTLLDADDCIVLFVPYYFNHLMAIQASVPGPPNGTCFRHRLLRHHACLLHPLPAGLPQLADDAERMTTWSRWASQRRPDGPVLISSYH